MAHSDFSFRQNMLISREHPSLDGHFPGDPIVPGVVILDQLISLWQKRTNTTIQQVHQTKFVQLLRPDVQCTIKYTVQYHEVPHDKALSKSIQSNKVNFLITDETQTIIAKGLFSYEQ